jgi:CrcB protein
MFTRFRTRRQVETILLIGIGGFIGANLRYAVSVWAAGRFGLVFPWGTLIINVTGSFILALFLGYAVAHTRLDDRVRLLLAVGFCGAYTTFSTYAVESIALMQGGAGDCDGRPGVGVGTVRW